MTGTQVSRVAYPLLVFSLGGSASDAGLISAAASVPYLILGIPAGVLVDRWNRKAIMIACDLGRFLTLGSIPLAALLGHLTPAQLAVTMALDSGLYVFFNAAQIAAIPRIVGTDQVASALARDQAALHAALLIGPPLGGYLFQVLGRTAPFLVDAFSYGVSATALLFIRTELQDSSAGRETPILREMGQGLGWLWNHSLARSLTLTTGVIFFVGNGSFLILVVLARHFGATPTGVGGVVAASSVGGLLGSALSDYVVQRLSFRAIVAGTVWVQAFLLPLYVLAPSSEALAVIASGIALVEAAADPVRYGYQIALMPDALRGRINSAASTVIFVPMWLGSAAAGLLLDRLGSAAAVTLFAALLAIPALLLSTSRDVRRVGKM